MNTYVYTSIALNYLPKARVLSTTLKKFHPDWVFCVVLAESMSQETKNQVLLYDDIDLVLFVDDFAITDGFGNLLSAAALVQWKYTHNIVEFCTAIKGSALCYLLNQPDCQQVFYFDPDIAIFDNLEPLINQFNLGASILLTPHAIEPETTLDGVWSNEISILKHGIYNLGFVGVNNDVNGHSFANWWKARLDMYCYDDVPNGVFTDQSWCDMVPAIFDGVKLLREPQYNVSTWNLTHRFVDGLDIHNLFVNKKYKLCFYHFSGFDSGAQIAMLLKYARKMPKLFLLRRWYKSECKRLENEYFTTKKWSFGCYNNGDIIEASQRIRYRTSKFLQDKFPNPFNGINENQNTIKGNLIPNSFSFKHKLKKIILRILHKIL